MLSAQLDSEELQLQGEIDFNEKIIHERQDVLNDAERLMLETNALAKQINSKVHEQRKDLVEIDFNAHEAQENAAEAEKNIEEAADH